MRTYVVTFEKVPVSAPQDFVAIPGATNKIVRILRFWIDPAIGTSLPGAQTLAIRCRILPATYTPGTGGTTGITPSKATSQGDAVSSITTAGTNNTSKATTNGTAVTRFEGSFHIFAGRDKRFDEPVEIIPTAGFVFELLDTPSTALTLSGGVEFQEIG